MLHMVDDEQKGGRRRTGRIFELILNPDTKLHFIIDETVINIQIIAELIQSATESHKND